MGGTAVTALLDELLDDASNLHERYSLLGSLAENIMTIGTVAGRFTACSSCGTTMATRGLVLECASCATPYELKPDSTYRPKSQGLMRFEVRGLERLGFSPTNWFLADENWSVGDIFAQLSRLPADVMLAGLLSKLQVPRSGNLEHVLYWPRFWFGRDRKTVQPDVVLLYSDQAVFFEFKRPAGAKLTPSELSGQAAFGALIEQRYGLRWHLVVVPGPARAGVPTPDSVADLIVSGMDAALEKWGFATALGQELRTLGPHALAERIRVLGWEDLLDQICAVITHSFEDSWNRRATIAALREFRARRASLGFFTQEGSAQAALNAG